MRFMLVCLLLTASGLALANPVTCTYGDLSRQIEVVYSNPGQPVPCEVIYDKSGEGSIETLWRASSEAGYCEDNAEGLASKLVNAGWSCESGGSSAAAPAEAAPGAAMAEAEEAAAQSTEQRTDQ